jgi:tRNA-specific 2-thiouridylase
MTKKPRICVAMSGGVDSSVVPIILKKRGFDVIGVTMQIWQESQCDPRHAGCCSLGAVEDARRAASIIGIPHYVVNFKDAFRSAVIDEFIDEYGKGRTPNPCVTCNREIKFDALLNKAAELGCDKLATGHYARVRYDKAKDRWRLMRTRGGNKDQSYALHMATQEQLSRLIFPLGELDGKHETREMARAAGLGVADKPDSQEICFVSEAGGYRQFLRKENPQMFEKGELVSPGGEVLGEHEGTADFTVGQRRGLGVAAGRPLYVISIDPKSRKVVVGDDDDLLRQRVDLELVTWSGWGPEDCPMKVDAKIRYNMAPQRGTLFAEPEPHIIFDKPVRAVTPGQTAVAYRGQSVVAGGRILDSR